MEGRGALCGAAANRWPALVVFGTCDVSLVWLRMIVADLLTRGSSERGLNIYLSTVPGRERSGCGVLACKRRGTVAASRLRHYSRERGTTAEDQVQAPAPAPAPAPPAAHRQQLQLHRGPLENMERQAGRQAEQAVRQAIKRNSSPRLGLDDQHSEGKHALR